MAVTTENVTFATLDTITLSGVFHPAEAPVGGAVVCHPHPLYGGNMDNPVVMSLVEACVAAGLSTLRFDFRGVRASAGTHARGVGERLDAMAAVDEVLRRVGPGMSVVMAGYSFGAVVALTAGRPEVDAWIGVAPPAAMFHPDMAAGADPSPKLLLLPEHDQYTKPGALAAAVRRWPATTVVEVTMADHFLNGRLGEVRREVGTFLAARVPEGAVTKASDEMSPS